MRLQGIGLIFSLLFFAPVQGIAASRDIDVSLNILTPGWPNFANINPAITPKDGGYVLCFRGLGWRRTHTPLAPGIVQVLHQIYHPSPGTFFLIPRSGGGQSLATIGYQQAKKLMGEINADGKLEILTFELRAMFIDVDKNSSAADSTKFFDITSKGIDLAQKPPEIYTLAYGDTNQRLVLPVGSDRFIPVVLFPGKGTIAWAVPIFRIAPVIQNGGRIRAFPVPQTALRKFSEAEYAQWAGVRFPETNFMRDSGFSWRRVASKAVVVNRAQSESLETIGAALAEQTKEIDLNEYDQWARLLLNVENAPRFGPRKPWGHTIGCGLKVVGSYLGLGK